MVEQFACGDDIFDIGHILPIWVDGVVGDDAHGRRGEQPPLFDFVDHLRGKYVGAYQYIGVEIGDNPREFTCAECVHNIEDADWRSEIRGAAVLGECVDQTIQLFGVLGGEQISLVNGALDNAVDIFVNIERAHFGAVRCPIRR